ncbi:MAG: PEP-CTERM sorting domain-containing protein [Planctomycetota bacterium]
MNSGFEDITGEVPFNEFTFGPFPGWDVYDPLGIAGSGNGPSIFLGTLTPNAPTFFDLGAPEGQRVGIAFGFFGSGGSGEYGLQQTLTETLQSHRRYELEVEIGNIASGTAVNNDFFNLDGFPGYRVDLMAGDSVIGQDLNTLAGSIPEGAFATSRISFTSGATHEAMGQELSIRLVNLNEVDPLFPNADLEVDFDNVRLTAVSVPEPSSLMFLIAIGSWMTLRRRDRSDRS